LSYNGIESIKSIPVNLSVIFEKLLNKDVPNILRPYTELIYQVKEECMKGNLFS
jgi:hypothetical protein